MSDLSGDLFAGSSWLEHLGLLHDPFSDQASTFRFYPAQRKSVLAQLHHLARYSQLMLLVVGPAGSGKSLLRQALMASSSKQATQCVSLSARSCAAPEDLLERIATQLGLAQASEAAVMARVAEASLSSQEIYLLVDDAEHLSVEALRVLLALSTGDAQGRVHVFLFGAPVAAERLAQLRIADEAVHVIHLQPYGFDETVAYLSQRLESAGGGIDLFDEVALEQIHRESEGWPGRINQLARARLMALAGEEAEALTLRVPPAPRSFALPLRYLVAAAAVGVAVWVAVSFFAGQNAGGSKAPALDSAALPADDASGREEVRAPIEFAGKTQPLPLPLVGESQPVMREPLASGAGGEADLDELEALPEVRVSAPSEAGPVRPVEVVQPVGAAAVAASEPPVRAPNTAPAVVRPAPAPAPVPAPTASAATPAPQPARATVSSPAQPSDWYLAQPAGSFLLQVLGTRSEQVAKDLVRKHGEGYRYFTKLHEGKPLHVVTFGRFASRNEAVRAVERLPVALKASKPWARRFEDVQREIRAAR